MPSKYQDAESRRTVKKGFPKEFKFTNPEELKSYFSGDRITCLRCGKEYKSIGLHLRTIHNMTVEEYQEMYGIPWTYGLTCKATKEKKRDITKKRIADGTMPWVGNQDMDKMRENLKTQRARQPVRETLVQRNLEKLNKDCTLENKARLAKMTRRGTPEFKEVMRNRPQTGNEIFTGWWKGKKQSPEHIAKRIANGLKTRESKK